LSSLGTRLLLIASLLMAAFFGVTGFVIEKAYQESAEATLRERLQVYAYTLIAATEELAEGGVQIAYPVSELRFFLAGSGLYGRIARNDGMYAWTSPSMDGLEIDFPRGLGLLAQRFGTLSLPQGGELGTFSVGIAWEASAPYQRVYTVSVAEDLTAFHTQLGGFRRTLWSWLGVLALILLAVQWGVLRWGLTPLRRVAADLLAIERGDKASLDGRYPDELRGLTANLNTLVHNERSQRERYRHALGDLAHSLKTPLAIMRGGAEGGESPDAFRATVETQVGRMSQLVDYQLRRAATGGRTLFGAPLDPRVVAGKVRDALDKVYADKRVRCTVSGESAARFRGDEDDLLEILGNLPDNGYKWCAQRVAVDFRRLSAADGTARLEIRVEDDGPGVDPAHAAHLFQRGARAGENKDGHGIGLAMVRDIVAVYGGTAAIERSTLGGAKFIVVI
jgi:two-component system sensor histidine kinase PhoQ